MVVEHSVDLYTYSIDITQQQEYFPQLLLIIYLKCVSNFLYFTGWASPNVMGPIVTYPLLSLLMGLGALITC